MYGIRLQNVRDKLAMRMYYDKIAGRGQGSGYNPFTTYEHLLPIRRVHGVPRDAEGRIKVMVTGRRGEDLGRFRMSGAEYTRKINEHYNMLRRIPHEQARSPEVRDRITAHVDQIRERKVARARQGRPAVRTGRDKFSASAVTYEDLIGPPAYESNLRRAGRMIGTTGF